MVIAIVDYGAGNISSMKNALDSIGETSIITSNPEEIKKADKIVFPGVGSFGYVMKNLNQKNLVNSIKSGIKSGKPYLGICLGLQVLFEESKESPGIGGLSIFKGSCEKFSKGKVPQIGWNKAKFTNGKSNFFYFVHSFYVAPKQKEIIFAETNYYVDYCSAIKYKNITAVQFHPEKSGRAGIDFLRRWVNENDK
tara:strand:- start:2061 stop:2645 length:585 start_codon:yes stop_codon:yes gene_type:complete